MKFVLEVSLDGMDDAAKELGRVLRYWGGNLHHYELKPGDASAVYDSSYRDVGRWSITAS